MAKSVPGFESNWELVGSFKNSNLKRIPSNFNNLKKLYQEEGYKMLCNYFKKLTEKERKKVVAVKMNKGYSRKY